MTDPVPPKAASWDSYNNPFQTGLGPATSHAAEWTSLSSTSQWGQPVIDSTQPPIRRKQRKARQHRRRHVPVGPAGVWFQQQQQHDPSTKGKADDIGGQSSGGDRQDAHDDEGAMDFSQIPKPANNSASETGGLNLSFSSNAWFCMQCDLNLVIPSLPPYLLEAERRSILRRYLPDEYMLLPELEEIGGRWKTDRKLLVVVQTIQSLTDNLWTITVTDETGATAAAWIQPRLVTEEQQRPQPAYIRPGYVWLLDRNTTTTLLVLDDNHSTGMQQQREQPQAPGNVQLRRMLLISEANILRVWTLAQSKEVSDEQYVQWIENRQTLTSQAMEHARRSHPGSGVDGHSSRAGAGDVDDDEEEEQEEEEWSWEEGEPTAKSAASLSINDISSRRHNRAAAAGRETRLQALHPNHREHQQHTTVSIQADSYLRARIDNGTSDSQERGTAVNCMSPLLSPEPSASQQSNFSHFACPSSKKKSPLKAVSNRLDQPKKDQPAQEKLSQADTSPASRILGATSNAENGNKASLHNATHRQPRLRESPIPTTDQGEDKVVDVTISGHAEASESSTVPPHTSCSQVFSQKATKRRRKRRSTANRTAQNAPSKVWTTNDSSILAMFDDDDDDGIDGEEDLATTPAERNNSPSEENHRADADSDTNTVQDKSEKKPIASLFQTSAFAGIDMDMNDLFEDDD